MIVLTPHPGEMARLAGMSIQEVEADREACPRNSPRPCRDRGVKRVAHAHRPSRRPHRHQHHRQSRNGQRRER